VHEAEFFVSSLSRMGFHLGAVVLNKALPGWLLAEAPARLAERLRDSVEPAAAALAPALGPVEPAQVHRVLLEVADAFLNYQVVAQREAEQKAELAVGPEVVVTVPAFDQDIHDLAGLLRLGEALVAGG
jgi:anion-transporting  ArsA/GET3 family ATPase